MSTSSRIGSLARIAVLSATLFVPVMTVAHADDEYGTFSQHDALIRQAAKSQSEPGDSRLATTARTAGGKRDIAGANGKLDEVYRQIYRPGSLTDQAAGGS